MQIYAHIWNIEWVYEEMRVDILIYHKGQRPYMEK
jgi:hypothetical protein